MNTLRLLSLLCLIVIATQPVWSAEDDEQTILMMLLGQARRGDAAGFLELCAPELRRTLLPRTDLARSLKAWSAGVVRAEILSLRVLETGDIQMECQLTRRQDSAFVNQPLVLVLTHGDRIWLLRRMQPEP